jgi:hypothetical protein
MVLMANARTSCEVTGEGDACGARGRRTSPDNDSVSSGCD